MTSDFRDWEDEDDPPPLPRPRRRPSDPLLAPLSEAVEALSRLDARVEAASAAVRDGFVAALAFREAAGMLAAAQAWVHPRDLALRDLALTGAYDAAATAGAAAAALPNTLPADGGGTPSGWVEGDLAGLIRDEAAVPAALHLSRLLRHLPRRRDPLATAETAAPLLSPLGARALDPAAFLRWRDGLLPVAASARTPLSTPPLLAAAAAARGWMESGIVPDPTPAQALAVAALRLGQARVPRVIPLPVWSGWPAIGRPYHDGLPRLRSGLAPPQAEWEADFLRLVAEAARAGLRDLARLLAAEATGRSLAARGGARSRLGAALDEVLRVPALTPKALAARIGVTHQAALRLLAVLAEAGVVAEITGRRSFRAFAVL